MMDNQSKYELKIFRRFATICDLPIITKSIEKRNPPEPDIKCNVEKVGNIAFEITELIDRGFANILEKQIDTKTELEKHYSQLDDREKEKFFSKYSDAIIFIHWENSLSLKRRKKLFPKLFKHLLSLNDHFEGNTLERDPKFAGKLDWITISRGVYGPLFDDVPASVIGDPTINSIQSKFLKKYPIEYPLHLLAFIDLNPMLPDHIWLSNASDYIRNNIEPSQFSKVWIFDFHKEEIKYSYP